MREEEAKKSEARALREQQEEDEREAKAQQRERQLMQEKESKEKAEQDLFRKFSKNLEARVPISVSDRDRLLLERMKHEKIIQLDELAFDLQITTRDLVTKIEVLIQGGKARGIFDDRGLFIQLTPEEFDQIAQEINRRGRIPKSELLELANQIVKQYF